jgi:predicted lipoprotein with Yx(FWY)xxD motif
VTTHDDSVAEAAPVRVATRWTILTSLESAASAGVVATAAIVLVPSAASASRVAPKSKSAEVVQVVDRAPFGQMLATVKGLSLYVDPSPCTGSCLTVWPPLFMPKGKKTPTGTTGLGTVKLGKHLQVTYNGQALYTFASDSGSSVNGNGVGGFMVATVG